MFPGVAVKRRRTRITETAAPLPAGTATAPLPAGTPNTPVVFALCALLEPGLHRGSSFAPARQLVLRPLGFSPRDLHMRQLRADQPPRQRALLRHRSGLPRLLGGPCPEPQPQTEQRCVASCPVCRRSARGSARGLLGSRRKGPCPRQWWRRQGAGHGFHREWQGLRWQGAARAMLAPDGAGRRAARRPPFLSDPAFGNSRRRWVILRLRPFRRRVAVRRKTAAGSPWLPTEADVPLAAPPQPKGRGPDPARDPGDRAAPAGPNRGLSATLDASAAGSLYRRRIAPCFDGRCYAALGCGGVGIHSEVCGTTCSGGERRGGRSGCGGGGLYGQTWCCTVSPARSREVPRSPA
jgi:hypothetical protein